MSGKTKSDSISAEIEKNVSEYGIQQKIVSITTDNAANCALAIKKIEALTFKNNRPMHIRCAAHSVNLIVKNGLKHVEEIMSNIRKSIHAIRSSPKKMKELEDICAIKKIQFDRPKNDVPTRW